VPVSSLVNADGSIDSGLPKSAAPGAKLPKDGDAIAILTTNQGTIVLKFFPQKAPNHVKNFTDLAKKNFYNGTKFHRVIPGFMIQGGDPNTRTDNKASWGQGGPGYNVKQEFNDIPHTRGILSMARTGDPDGAGSQFFIMHARYPSLDGQYTVFGQVIEGMDVVDKIVNTPTEDANRPVKDMVLEKVEITKWPVKLK
jgi:peptidyl-prolyl cis-trans isomerase B (cyclophilin B)